MQLLCRVALRVAVLLAVPLLGSVPPTIAQQEHGRDFKGAYRFEDGGLVTVHIVVDPEAHTRYWRYRDLTSGASHKLVPDGELSFYSGSNWSGEEPVENRYEFAMEADRVVTLTIESVDRTSRVARRVEFPEITTTFQNGDVTLYGTLVLPLEKGPHPAVVIAHGSDRTSAVDEYFFPYLFAEHGIATFIYDKRGTGRSTGEFSQNFPTLAGDLVAAVEWMKTRPELDASRIGAAGFSQGGWIAPLAALQSSAIRYILVGYGLAMSVADEDRYETPLKLRALGFDDAAIAEFEDFNRTLHETARAEFASGWDDIETKAALYADREWLAALPPDTWAGFVMQMGLEQAKQVAPLIMAEVDPFYDPIPTLEQLDIPMLWLIAGDDIEAPPDVTIAALERLRTELDKPFETIVFPGADHGMTLYEEGENERIRTRYAPGYFDAMTDWLRTQAGLE